MGLLEKNSREREECGTRREGQRAGESPRVEESDLVLTTWPSCPPLPLCPGTHWVIHSFFQRTDRALFTRHSAYRPVIANSYYRVHRDLIGSVFVTFDETETATGKLPRLRLTIIFILSPSADFCPDYLVNCLVSNVQGNVKNIHK